MRVLLVLVGTVMVLVMAPTALVVAMQVRSMEGIPHGQTRSTRASWVDPAPDLYALYIQHATDCLWHAWHCTHPQ
jgi:hypothetical protein